MEEDTESQAEKIQQFMAKRSAIMRGMAAEMSAADALDPDAEQRPHVEKMLSLIDSLDIDAKDKQLLAKRVLQQASSIFQPPDDDAKAEAKALLEENAYSEYEFYLFVLMVVLVLSVFGKM